MSILVEFTFVRIPLCRSLHLESLPFSHTNEVPCVEDTTIGDACAKVPLFRLIFIVGKINVDVISPSSSLLFNSAIYICSPSNK